MSTRIIFLDTETTGLCPAYEKIVEIAAIEVDKNYQPLRVFHEYLDPKKKRWFLLSNSWFIRPILKWP